MKKENTDLLPNETFRALKRERILDDCPFCGHKLYAEEPDTLYPNGLGYIDTEEFRHFVSLQETEEPVHGICYKVTCSETSGGCGATINGDSREQAIRKWNRRHE